MKRFFSVFLILCIIFSLSSCSERNSPNQPNEIEAESKEDEIPESEPEETETTEGIEVDRELFDVTITLPPDFAEEGATQEHYDEAAKENGWKSATLNEDGSVTYVMTRGQHKELMGEITESIETSLSEMVGSEEFPNIVSVSANDDYTEFSVVTKSEELDISESFTVLGFYMYGGLYHAFNGTNVDNIHVEFINEATGQIIEEANSFEVGSE